MNAHDRDQAVAALRRLWTHANGYSGQCRTIAAFLLGLYNGYRFPFDLNDFRTLDACIFHDCLTVLALDFRPDREVHERLGVSCKEFEQLAADWAIHDRSANNLASNA